MAYFKRWFALRRLGKRLRTPYEASEAIAQVKALGGKPAAKLLAQFALQALSLASEKRGSVLNQALAETATALGEIGDVCGIEALLLLLADEQERIVTEHASEIDSALLQRIAELPDEVMQDRSYSSDIGDGTAIVSASDVVSLAKLKQMAQQELARR